MKIRDKILYMTYGAGLVVLGMVLNSLIDDADAQSGLLDMNFGKITCQNLVITDKNGKPRGLFGLSSGDAILEIFGDDRKTQVAYLGGNDKNGEMMLRLKSKSTTDKRELTMFINEYGGRFDCNNKMGENVVLIAVANDGGGGLELKDKYGYKR